MKKATLLLPTLTLTAFLLAGCATTGSTPDTSTEQAPAETKSSPSPTPAAGPAAEPDC
jgi:hypothetical protein